MNQTRRGRILPRSFWPIREKMPIIQKILKKGLTGGEFNVILKLNVKFIVKSDQKVQWKSPRKV